METANTSDEKYNNLGKYFYYHFYSERECHFKYAKIIKDNFPSVNELKVMEIGAGTGSNLLYFKYLGIEWSNIYANEVSPERGISLKKNLPSATIHICDAIELDYCETFDVVFQSTVFTSILSEEKKKMLANKMFAMTKKNGIVLWYDFIYNSPNNDKVKGIGKSEIKKMFPKAHKITFYKTTLLPPLARRMGRIYPFLNKVLFPLRTHLIAVINK